MFDERVDGRRLNGVTSRRSGGTLKRFGERSLAELRFAPLENPAPSRASRSMLGAGFV